MLKERKNIFMLFICIVGILQAIYGLVLFLVVKNTMFGIVWIVLGLINLVLAFILRKKMILSLLLCAVLVLFIGFDITIMLKGNDSQNDHAEYVLVLGYQLSNNQMSDTLEYRLEKALDYSKDNPDTTFILCGGVTRENTISEASVMYDWLIDKGLSNERIIVEDQSTDTIENIANACQYFEREQKIGVLSSNYHVFRAKMICKKRGIEAYGIAAKAPLLLIPNQLLTEKLGLLLVLF